MIYSDNTYILLLRVLQRYTRHTVGELAEQLGVSGAYVSMMIHGTRGITTPFKNKLVELSEHYLGKGSTEIILLSLNVIDTHLKTKGAPDEN